MSLFYMKIALSYLLSIKYYQSIFIIINVYSSLHIQFIFYRLPILEIIFKINNVNLKYVILNQLSIM